MVSKKSWMILLILVNVFLLLVMYTVIEQRKYHHAPKDRALFSQHDKFPEQSVHYKNSNYSKQTSAKATDRDKTDGNKLSADADINNSTENQKNNNTVSNDSDEETENKSYKVLIEEATAKRDEVLQNVAKIHPDKCYNNCDDRVSAYKKSKYNFLQPNFKVNESLFAVFKENETIVECDGKIEVHYKHFAILHDVSLQVHKWQATGLIKAGKELHTFKDHALRTDEAEVLKPTKGLLSMDCPAKHGFRFDNTTLDNVLMLKYLTVNWQNNPAPKSDQIQPRQFTVAVQREDYANFYHIMLHIHSIFTMLMVFHQQPINVSVLIFDAHPQAEVDEMLETLFGPLIRVTKLTQNVKFQNLVLSLKEGKSLFSKYWIISLPHLEDFRSFVYNQYALNENHFLNCRKLTITFIWRRDKIWHPRNLKGSVQRKIFNEAEIYKVVYDKYPNVCINGLLLESVPMKEQLKFIGKTDILIGMHGAGLTHAVFLPKTSGFIELFPQNFRKMFHYYKLFEVIAKRRDLHYLYWENTISEHEMPNYFTRVDPVSFLSVVDSMIQKVCARNSQNY